MSTLVNFSNGDAILDIDAIAINNRSPQNGSGNTIQYTKYIHYLSSANPPDSSTTLISSPSTIPSDSSDYTGHFCCSMIFLYFDIYRCDVRYIIIDKSSTS